MFFVNFSGGTERSDELAAFLTSPVLHRVPEWRAAATKRRTVASPLLRFRLPLGGFGTVFLASFFPRKFWHDQRLASTEARLTARWRWWADDAVQGHYLADPKSACSAGVRAMAGDLPSAFASVGVLCGSERPHRAGLPAAV